MMFIVQKLINNRNYFVVEEEWSTIDQICFIHMSAVPFDN
jgi:hypothetical protein